MSRENRPGKHFRINAMRGIPVNKYLRSNITDSTPYAPDLGKPGHGNALGRVIGENRL